MNSNGHPVLNNIAPCSIIDAASPSCCAEPAKLRVALLTNEIPPYAVSKYRELCKLRTGISRFLLVSTGNGIGFGKSSTICHLPCGAVFRSPIFGR